MLQPSTPVQLNYKSGWNIGNSNFEAPWIISMYRQVWEPHTIIIHDAIKEVLHFEPETRV